jgi:hypothetical protein
LGDDFSGGTRKIGKRQGLLVPVRVPGNGDECRWPGEGEERLVWGPMAGSRRDYQKQGRRLILEDDYFSLRFAAPVFLCLS